MNRFHAAVICALLGTGSAAAAQPAACKPVPEKKIALQFFSMLNVFTAPGGDVRERAIARSKVGVAELEPVFARLHAMGLRNIERFAGTMGATTSDYAALLKRTGMASIAGHEQLTPASWDKVLDQAKALGQTFVGSGGFGGPGFATLESTLETAANLNRLGSAARAKGLTLYVHNHAAELTTKFPYDLKKTGNPQPTSVWEIVAANTDPKNVAFEVDVHWSRVGFGLDRFDDLLAFLRRYRGRIQLLHIKDTAADGSITDLGKGTTNWPAVYKAAGPAVRYYIWEYDNAPDPLKSAAIAADYFKCRKGGAGR